MNECGWKVGDVAKIVEIEGYSEDFSGQECVVVRVYNYGVDLEVIYEDCSKNVLYFEYNQIVPVSYNETTVKEKETITEGSAASSNHYINDALQPIEIMQMTFSKEEFIGFLKGNIVKYSFRAGKKQGESSEKDMNKVKQYKLWLDVVNSGGVVNPREHVI